MTVWGQEERWGAGEPREKEKQGPLSFLFPNNCPILPLPSTTTRTQMAVTFNITSRNWSRWTNKNWHAAFNGAATLSCVSTTPGLPQPQVQAQSVPVGLAASLRLQGGFKSRDRDPFEVTPTALLAFVALIKTL